MADIKLTQVKSGGGGVPINSMLPFEGMPTKFDFQGATYLRTGYLETDEASYPDAVINAVTQNDSGTLLFTPAAQISAGNLLSMTVDPATGFIYLLSNTDKLVYVYDSVGVYQSVLPSLNQGGNITTAPSNIHIYNNFLYVIEVNKISRYNLAGTLLEAYPNTIPQNPVSIIVGSTYIHNNIVYQSRYATNQLNIYATDLNSTDNGALIFTQVITASGYNSAGLIGYGGTLMPIIQSGTTAPRIYSNMLRGLGEGVETKSGSGSDYGTLSIAGTPTVKYAALNSSNGTMYQASDTSVYKFNGQPLPRGVGIPTSMYAYQDNYTSTSGNEYMPYYVRIK